MTNKACVFVGPSLSDYVPSGNFDVFPPVTRGAVIAAADAGYKRIGLIDGAIEEADRVAVSELKEVLSRNGGVTLWGGASVGALRATQLEHAGMRGVGRVFRLYRRGVLRDSDEVFVMHAPEALKYRCLTLPLVNIRFTLRRLRRKEWITRKEEQAFIRFMQNIPWFDRDHHSLAAAAFQTCGRLRTNEVLNAFDQMYHDVKRQDALAVLVALSHREAGKSTTRLRSRATTQRQYAGAIGAQ